MDIVIKLVLVIQVLLAGDRYIHRGCKGH